MQVSSVGRREEPRSGGPSKLLESRKHVVEIACDHYRIFDEIIDPSQLLHFGVKQDFKDVAQGHGDRGRVRGDRWGIHPGSIYVRAGADGGRSVPIALLASGVFE